MIIIIMNTFIISGCWNYREVSELNIIHGAAVDQSDDKYKLTLEIIKPMGGQDMKIEADVISQRGDSLFDAARNIILDTGKKGYWSHAKVLVISHEVAKKGVVPVLDFINRDAEARSDIWLLVSEDANAGDIFKGKDKLHSTISAHLEDLLKNEKGVSKFQSVEVSKFMDDLSAEGISATLPTTSIIKKNEDVVPKVYGTAVFKKDKMVGWIDGTETKSMLLIKDELEGGLYPIRNIDKIGTTAVLEIFNAKTKVKPVIKDGNISMKIDSEIDVGIAELTTPVDYISKKGREKLKKYAEAAVKSQLESVIKKAQKEYDSDIFGFGSIVYREKPKVWKKIKSDWDEIFADLDTNINVKINIKGSGLTSKPIKVGD